MRHDLDRRLRSHERSQRFRVVALVFMAVAVVLLVYALQVHRLGVSNPKSAQSAFMSFSDAGVLADRSGAFALFGVASLVASLGFWLMARVEGRP